MLNMTLVSSPPFSSASIVTGKTETVWTPGETDRGTSLVPEGCVVLRFTDYVPWSNPQMLISQEVEELFQTVVFSALLPLSFLISVPTNIINMIVFYKHGLKERINVCVFYLSLVDMLYVLLAFLFQGDTMYLKIKNMSRYSLIRGFFIVNKMAGVLGVFWVSTFVSMVIACERCFCVMSPLKAQRALQTKTTVVVLVLVSLAITAAYFVVGARWTVACVLDTLSNVTYLTSYPSSFYLSHRKAIDTLDGVVYGLVLPNVCVGVVALCTTITIVKLRIMATWRHQSSSADTVSTRDVALTRMLIGTSLVFMACSLPGIAFRTAMLFVPDLSVDGHYRNVFYLLFFMHQEASYLCCTFNFFVYYKYGTKFRETVRDMFVNCNHRCAFSFFKKHSPVIPKHRDLMSKQSDISEQHGAMRHTSGA